MSESSRGRVKKTFAPRGRGGRRTQAERDQLSQAEQARNRERDEQYRKEQNAARLAAERAERDKRHREEKAARGRNRGRGGFIGQKLFSSGPLGAGSVIDASLGAGRAFPRPWEPSEKSGTGTRGLGSGAGEASGMSSSHGGYTGGSGSGSASMHYDFQYSETIKEENDGGYISSDLDDPKEGVRKAIEHINLVSDDDDEDEGGLRSMNLPIHMPRNRHEDRVEPVNPDASDAAVIKAEDDEVPVADAHSSSKKGKSRVKDVDVVSERIWKGVWADSTDSDVKEESDNEPLPAGVTQPGREAAKIKDEEEETKPKRTRRSETKAPQLYTDYERKEYARQLEDGNTLLAEFSDESTDRNNQVYIFQFPPIIPNLKSQTPIVIKDDPDGPPQPPAALGDSADNPSNRDAPIKVEDDVKDQQPTRPSFLPDLAPGAVGKMCVHKSGKVTMSWGGIPFIVQNGNNPTFLQNLVMTKVEPAKPGATVSRSVPGVTVGDAAAFGQPRGKLVLTPDFDTILMGVKGLKVT